MNFIHQNMGNCAYITRRNSISNLFFNFSPIKIKKKTEMTLPSHVFFKNIVHIHNKKMIKG